MLLPSPLKPLLFETAGVEQEVDEAEEGHAGVKVEVAASLFHPVDPASTKSAGRDLQALHSKPGWPPMHGLFVRGRMTGHLCKLGQSWASLVHFRPSLHEKP